MMGIDPTLGNLSGELNVVGQTCDYSVLFREAVAEWPEYESGEWCPEFESCRNLAIFQAIIEWLKKPTCCYATLSSTASALGTSGGGMSLHRRHLKNTACTTNG